MDFEVSYTPKSLSEADRMARRWYFWPAFVLQNLSGIGMVIFLLIGGVTLVIESLFNSTLDVPRAALGACIVTIPGGAFWWYCRREARKTSESLAAVNPLLLSFTSDGISTKEKNGATSFVPWSSFRGFREGRTVILLDETTSRNRRMIPTDSLSSSDVQSIRNLVRSHLPNLD